MAGFMISLAIVEVIPILRWEDVEREPAPVYRWMRDNRTRLGPTLELPMSHAMAFEYVRASTTHHVPIVNGTSGFEPPLHVELRQKDERLEFDDEFLSLLEKNRVRYVVVHIRRLEQRTGAVLAWLKRNVNRGRLAFVRRFDNADVAGDWVFAITRNAPGWASLRGLQAPDRAGHIPDENLARLFAHKAVYNASTFYNIEGPQSHSSITGELKVSGWALSPAGIRSITARVHEGRHAFEGQLVERGDVTRDWQWYPETPKPGFIITVPKRPRGVPRETDVYLEIVDGEGRVTRTPDLFLSWE